MNELLNSFKEGIQEILISRVESGTTINFSDRFSTCILMVFISVLFAFLLLGKLKYKLKRG